MAASFKLHLSGNFRERFNPGILEILSLPLQVSDASPRVSKQFNPNDASVVPEGAGDRARQPVLVQDQQYKVFQEAIARATASCSIEGTSGKKGCQLAFLARQIREHYNEKEKRSNKISTRLIGEQAIYLARYSFRLIDALACSRLSVSGEDRKKQRGTRRRAGSGGERGRNGRACKHCFKNLIPVYQLPVYPLIG